MGQFVNKYQTKEERRTKYWMLRQVGFTVPASNKMRDWTWPHVLKHVARTVNSWERRK